MRTIVTLHELRGGEAAAQHHKRERFRTVEAIIYGCARQPKGRPRNLYHFSSWVCNTHRRNDDRKARQKSRTQEALPASNNRPGTTNDGGLTRSGGR